MKLKHIITLFASSFLLLMACEKNEWTVSAPENRDFSNKGFIKVYNATIASPVNRVYVDDNVVANGTNAYLGFTNLFPATTAYGAFDPGARKVTIKDTAAVPKLNTSVTVNVEAGKNYTVFMYDSLNTVKTKVATDDLTRPTDTTAKLRFANLLFSSTPIPNIDIFSQNKNANIFTNVPVADVTAYIVHPSMRADTFRLRATGTTTNLSSLFFTPDQRRIYTLIARGRYQATSGATAPTLTVMTNY